MILLHGGKNQFNYLLVNIHEKKKTQKQNKPKSIKILSFIN